MPPRRVPCRCLIAGHDCVWSQFAEAAWSCHVTCLPRAVVPMCPVDRLIRTALLLCPLQPLPIWPPPTSPPRVRRNRLRGWPCLLPSCVFPRCALCRSPTVGGGSAIRAISRTSRARGAGFAESARSTSATLVTQAMPSPGTIRGFWFPDTLRYKRHRLCSTRAHVRPSLHRSDRHCTRHAMSPQGSRCDHSQLPDA